MISNADRICENIDRKCELFYEYVMNSLTETKPLTEKVKKFAIDNNYLLSLNYVINKFNRGEIETEEDIKINDAIKALLIIFVLVLISFIVSIIVINGGNV